MSFIEKLFSPGHSIAWDYISSFSELHEILPHIHDFIVSCPKTGLVEIADGVWASPTASIARTAVIMPPCLIGEGAEIRHSAYIRGNAVIGDNAVIGNSCEIKNAIISDNAEIPHFNYVGDSILGYKAHMGAGAITSNVRSDKKPIVLHINGKDLHTKLHKVGAFIGDRAEIGCNAVLNPGTIIGKDSIIYPLSSVRGYVPERMIYKANGNCVQREEKYMGWKEDVLEKILSLNKKEFTLDEVYQFEDELQRLYSNNHNVQAKIRQQLQMLRDDGILEFIAPGRYRLTR